MSVRINKDAWSEESKESLSYEFAKKYYENINYSCRKCKKNTIYSAEEQKRTYEILKCYIEKQRVLCGECYKKYNILVKKIKEYESLWAKETINSKKNATYLKKWLSAINEMSSYGKSKNEAMANNLLKLISGNAK